MSDTTMLEAALRYASRDIRLFPLYEIIDGRCACGKDDCKSPGKHPRNSNGVTGATKDEAQIRNWWQQWPAANIGVATGDRFWALDVDPRHGGNDSIMALIHDHGSMPETIMVNTGGGGRHYYFEANGVPVSSSTGIMPGIDVKSTGGYVVAPPSNHISGNRYTVAPGSPKELAPTPAWLMALVTAKSDSTREPFDTAAVLSGVPEGSRDEDLFRLASKLRRADVPFDAALELVLKAARKCIPPFPENEARAKVENAYRRYDPTPEAPLPVTDDEIEREAIQSESNPEREPAAAFIPQEYWRQFDVADIHNWECPPLEPLIEGILAKGNLCWLAAETQTGKTLFMLWICLQLLRKGTLFGKYAVTPVKRILYVACEDPARRFKARLLDMMSTEVEAGRFVVYVAPGLSLADVLCFQFLENMIREGGFDLVIIDTFQAATMGISSFDDEKLSIVIQHLLGITRKLGTTIVVNDHFRKTQVHKKRSDLDLNDVKGSGGKLQNADVFLLMDRQNGQLRISGRSKEWDKGIGFLVNIAPQGSHEAEKFTFAGDLEDMAGSMVQVGEVNRQKVLEAVPGNDWVTCAQIAEATGLKDRTVNNHLTKLIEAELVHSNGEKGKAIKYQSGKGIAQGELTLCANAISDIGSGG